eukprot:CAMPEP_0167773408 /NCGR_PEP_ID=MMETSP0111_2-20121227/1401_1 /TAXON_ID=91324 /ORGANISM="Lotharella globosa, Strain CCCM811" /LENGTH=298 /DNA_ID=CAMNT_0007663037 /DNA_START=12 /DNA_END=908 /DNA_ORIENTATION=+
MTVGLAGLGLICPGLENGKRNWLPDATTSPQKRKWELFSLQYGCFWILCFGIIIGGELFVWFDDVHYMVVCVGLASPLLLQPFLFPSITNDSDVVWYERYSVKANTWIAIFSFIGNYWYTHYFYTVLQSYYTMPSWDLNGVPIPLYFATHFYFSFYHVLANLALRKTFSTLAPGTMRNVFVVALVIEISYITAFMESLTISGFPCYGFSDRFLAYTLGSAFYGLYFVVSFPMFLRVDENGTRMSLFTVVVEALASGMAVLILLDAVRVALGQDLVLKLDRPCKSDPALTCEPFTYKTC